MSLRRSEVTSDRRKVGELGVAEEQEPVNGLPALAFGPFVAEADTGRLLESGRLVSLAPKPFETLYYLASRPGRVVPKTELMERLWPGTFVTDDVLVQCVVDIRRALHDPAKNPQYMRTIPRRGLPVPGGRRAGAGRTRPRPTAQRRPQNAAPIPERAAAGFDAAPLARSLVAARGGGPRARAAGRHRVVRAGNGQRASFARRAHAVEPGSLLVMPLDGRGADAGERLAAPGPGRDDPLAARPDARASAWWPATGWPRALAEAGYTEDDGALGGGRVPGRARPAGGEARHGLVRARRGPVRADRPGRGRRHRAHRGDRVRARAASGGPARRRGRAVPEAAAPPHALAGPGRLGFRPARLATRSVEASRQYVEALTLQARGGRAAVGGGGGAARRGAEARPVVRAGLRQEGGDPAVAAALGLRRPGPGARDPGGGAPGEGAARPRAAAGRELRGAHPAAAARGRAAALERAAAVLPDLRAGGRRARSWSPTRSRAWAAGTR